MITQTLTVGHVMRLLKYILKHPAADHKRDECIKTWIEQLAPYADKVIVSKYCGVIRERDQNGAFLRMEVRTDPCCGTCNGDETDDPEPLEPQN